MSTGDLATAIESDDAKKIATIPGIGPKTASRIVLELKGKVVVPDSYVAQHAAPQNEAIEDALRGLGLQHARSSSGPRAARRSRTTKAPRCARRCNYLRRQ